jgi:O-antigen ligase
MTTRTLGHAGSPVSGETSPAREMTERTTAGVEPAKVAFVLLWLFTFVGFGRPEDLFPAVGQFHLTLVSAVSALVAYMGAVLIDRARFAWSRELLLGFLLTGWFVLGLPFAYYRGGSFGLLTQTWIRTLIFFFLLTQTLTTVSRVRKILWAVLLSELIASSASILLQGNPSLEQGDRLSGVNQGLLGWNFLGITLSVTLPFFAALYISKRSAPRTALLIAILGSTMWMLVLTASRGGFLGIIFSIILTWWFILRGSSRGRRVAVLLLLCLPIVLAKAPKVFWSRLQTTWNGSASRIDLDAASAEDVASAEESTRGREILLENSLKYTAQFPVFGVGIGGFPIYNGKTIHRSNAWLGTHNTFTQLSSEAGIPALAIFLWLLFTALARMKKINIELAADEESAELRLLATATRVSMWAFAFSGFFAHIAYEYLFYYIAGIAAGLWTISRRRIRAPESISGLSLSGPSRILPELLPR